MAEVIGLVASVITVAEIAYQSTIHLYKLIDGFRTASQTLCDLYTDLSDVHQLLLALQNTLKDLDEKRLTEGLRRCLQNLKPSIDAYHRVCIDFEKKVTQITSHSTRDHLSFRDNIRIQFEEKGILAFVSRLASHKATISIVLGLLNLTSSEDHRQSHKELEASIIAAISVISGRIEGIEISLQSLRTPGVIVHDNVRAVVEALDEHRIALQQCCRVCTSVSEAAPVYPSETVKRMEGYDQASQLVAGDIGDAGERFRPVTIGIVSGRQRTKQVMVQNVGADSIEKLLSFMDSKESS